MCIRIGWMIDVSAFRNLLFLREAGIGGRIHNINFMNVRIIPLQNVPETWFTPPCWTSPARRCPCHGRNVRHERMHRTLKMEATRPAGSNFLQQQAKFDAFVHEFNNERPHEALDMKYPADIYKPSTRPYRGIGELSYPFHDRTALVTCCGRICIYKKKINLSTSLAGQAVGIKEVDDGICLVSFMDYDLGYIDLEEKTLQPLNNPFGPRV